MYCAIIAYCLVAIIGNKLKVERSIYEILQILSISLLDKTTVRELLTNNDYRNVKKLKIKQLIISGFMCPLMISRKQLGKGSAFIHGFSYFANMARCCSATSADDVCACPYYFGYQ